MRWFSAGLVVLLPVVVSCGDGPAGRSDTPMLNWGPGSTVLFEPPSTAEVGGIVGDWFACEGRSCEELDGEGLGFRPDGTVVALDAGGSLSPGESYCERIQELFRYEIRGMILVLIIENQRIEVPFSISADGTTLTLRIPDFSGGPEQAIVVRRVSPSRSTGPCDDFEDFPVGAPRPGTPPPPG